MSEEEIKRQLKLSKQQNKNERYDYLCSQFNCVNYAIKLEKYTNKLEQQNKKYKEVIDKLNIRIKQNKKNIDESGSFVETYTGWKLIPDYIDEIDKLKQEKKELKKQLEEKQNPLKGIFAQVNDDTLLRDCGNMNAEINELKNQQKEFIEYLENEIKIYNNVYMGEMLKEIEEILSKYKEIIGGKDER